MPRSEKQKVKMYYLLKLLHEKSDEQHPLPMKEILADLENVGIRAERKSIYDDIATLRQLGLEIILQNERPQGYYLVSRDFELPEVKMLVDVVQSAKFMTTKKSRELISKLEGLTSKYQAKELQGQVYVAKRVKTVNENIYTNIDWIQKAIREKTKLRFQYCEWTLEKKLVPKKDGKMYHVSPYALTWEDENYYMIAYDKEADTLKHYRVDKMRRLSASASPCEGEEVYKKFDLVDYSSKCFSMFGGEEKEVTLLMKNQLIGVAIDRFGTDIWPIPYDQEHFKITVAVADSLQFLAWVFGLGEDIEILEPQSVREEFKERIQSMSSKYSV